MKLVEMMFMGLNDLPCFALGPNLIGNLKERVLPPIANSRNRGGSNILMNEMQAREFVD